MSNPAFRHPAGAALPTAPTPALPGSSHAESLPDCPEVTRLRQVTDEMEQAIRLGDWNRAAHISGLLAPIVGACQQAAAESPGERSLRTQEVDSLQTRLEDCTVRLSAAMTEHSTLLARLRQSRRRAPYRPAFGNASASSRRLDTLR